MSRSHLSHKERTNKMLAILLVTLMLLSMLAGCSSSKKPVGKWYFWSQYKGEMGQEYDKTATSSIKRMYDLGLDFADDHTLLNDLIKMTDVNPVSQEIKIEGNQIFFINKAMNPNSQEYEKYATFQFRGDTLEIVWEGLPGYVYVFKKVKRSA